MRIMEKDTYNHLTDFEWTLLWMTLNYSMNRQTIASATMPGYIMTNWYKRLTGFQKKRIAKLLGQNEEDMERMGYSAFGDKEIDRPAWIKFWMCMDESSHYEVELTDGSRMKVFEANGQIVPLDKYIEEPFINSYVPRENIKL